VPTQRGDRRDMEKVLGENLLEGLTENPGTEISAKEDF
jgi:hypothetical protein